MHKRLKMARRLRFVWLPGWSYTPDMYDRIINTIDDATGRHEHLLIDFSKYEKPSDIIEQMATQNADRSSSVIIIGWSLGAMVAQKIIEATADHISAACLVSASPSFVKNATFPHGLPERQLRLLKKRVLTDPDKAVSDFRDSINPQLRTEAIANTPSNRTPQDTLLTGLDFLADYRIEPDVSRLIQMPVYLLHGRKDDVCPLGGAVQLQNIYPCSKLTISEEAGHDIPFIQPSYFVKWILALLDDEHLA